MSYKPINLKLSYKKKTEEKQNWPRLECYKVIGTKNMYNVDVKLRTKKPLVFRFRRTTKKENQTDDRGRKATEYGWKTEAVVSGKNREKAVEEVATKTQFTEKDVEEIIYTLTKEVET